MNKPLNTWRNKGLTVTAWSNKDYIAFTVQKRYRDKATQEWKETKTLFIDDIRNLEVLCQEANKWNHEYYNKLDTPEGKNQFGKPSESIKVEMKPPSKQNETISPLDDDDELPF